MAICSSENCFRFMAPFLRQIQHARSAVTDTTAPNRLPSLRM
jgi:hypothetical protein